MVSVLKEDAVYRIKDGKQIEIKRPESGYGKQTIIWQDGKIVNVEVSYTEK